MFNVNVSMKNGYATASNGAPYYGPLSNNVNTPFPNFLNGNQNPTTLTNTTTTLPTTTTVYPTTPPPTITVGIAPYNVGIYNPVTGVTTINISKGWNIIPNIGLNTAELTVCQPNYKSHFFMYSPLSSEYLNYSQTVALEASQGSYASLYTGWFYSTANCDIQYNISQDGQQYQNAIKLVTGWNFFTIKPWMLNKTFATEFGNCNVTEIAFWNATSQNWSKLGGSSGLSQISLFDQIHIGTPMIESSMLLKVPTACRLQSSVTGIPVPPAPPSSAK